jgi:hypothetical protein
MNQQSWGEVGEMVAARALRAPLTWTVAGMSVLDIAAAVLLAAGAAVLAFGELATPPSAAAFAGVLVMIAPVAWRRPAPLASAAALAVAAMLNGLLFGPLVRCGVALPAIFLVTFAVAARCDRARAAAGLLLCLGAAIAEGFYDPQIEGQGLVFVLPLLVAFFAAGRLVRARTLAAETLRSLAAELRRQREQTAHLAVLADRVRVSADVEATLHARLGDIAATAAAGLGAVGTDQPAARQALASIEHDGRAVLTHLREILGTLHDPASSQPQPTLARLSDLLAHATGADARLSVDGSARPLPAGLELSGYRIVEHLLLALDDNPGAAVDVRLRFGPDALELHVRGPHAPATDLRAILAAAKERAGLHGGTVDSRVADGVCSATARLPLVSGYA